MIRRCFYFVVLFSFLVISCRKDHTDEGTGKIILNFVHLVNGQPLILDSLCYVNAAGNNYEVTDYRYFISEVTLIRPNGDKVMLNKNNDIHYVDSQILATSSWEPGDDIPVGAYDSITFTFGINGDRNKSGLFVNPPEVNMFWPEFLGGGYHLMQLNGRWVDPLFERQPYSMHLGIGRDTLNSEVIFIQNYFKTTLAASGFSINKDKTLIVEIVMNIDSWFTTPNPWDWNIIGGGIMMNQDAMRMASENGYDVFSIGAKFQL